MFVVVINYVNKETTRAYARVVGIFSTYEGAERWAAENNLDRDPEWVNTLVTQMTASPAE